MKDFVGTLTKAKRWLIGIVLFFLFSSWVSSTSLIGPVISGAVLICLIVFLYLCRSVPAAPSAKEKAAAEEAAARKSELTEYQKRQLEIEETKLKNLTAETELLRLQVEQMKIESERKGKIITKVAGVTFDNKDGTERQDILRQYAENGSTDEISLVKSSYKGNDAVDVMCGAYCVGKIPKDVVPDVVSVIDCVSSVIMDVNTFENDEGDEIYRADLTIVYEKQ